MADVKWIKIVTDIFDDEKMLLIESLPSADSIIVIWFKLLCLAGKTNNNGVFLMNDTLAYTDEMLGTIFRRDVNTIRLALDTFERFGMIEVIQGVITIPNWGKHQTLDKIEKKTEYMRKYMQDYRKKQALQIECKTNSKSNCKANVNSLDKDIDKELDIEKEEEKELEKNNLESKDSMSSEDDYSAVMSIWNALDGCGNIKPIVNIKGKRRDCVRARLKEYGIEGFEKAIEMIKISEFLQGNNNKSWTVTFDWFIKPNNFVKVLEGNYSNKGGHSSRIEEVDSWV